MSDLGALLRKARMEKKISLEDLQETTKIRKAYLEAIEEGNYKVLPGNFYVRAFIKSYSEAVGLDPNEVLRLYQSVIPSPEPEHVEPIRSKRTTRNTERISRWASNAMMISFVVLILGIIYYYMQANYKGPSSDASNEPRRITDNVVPSAEPATPAAPAPTTGQGQEPNALAVKQPEPVAVKPPAPKIEVTLVKSERGIDYYTVSNTDKLQIQMKVTGELVWVEVDSLGEKRSVIDQGTYQNGSVQTWEMPNSAFLIFGRSNAVELMVNGTVVTVGDTSNPKRIQLDLQKTGA
jgi:cytoskeletal protein RodZ